MPLARNAAPPLTADLVQLRSSIAATNAIVTANRSTQFYPQNPIVPESPDYVYIREPGNAVYDATTAQWIVPYSVGYGPSSADITVNAHVSSDGETWSAHTENPISKTGSTAMRAEDPYIAKSISNGQVWRDSAGRALMFTEEKPGYDGQRGTLLFRSDPNLLTGWNYYGRVVDKGSVGTWDENDRTSPIVFHDGTKLHLLFEGRSPTNEGEIGHGTSTDEGLTWTLDPDPIITRGATGSWNDTGIVCDDIMKVGSTYVLVAHGAGTRPGNGYVFNNIGRYSTTVAPASWNASSFTEMTGNPFDMSTNTIMFHGNTPGRCLININNKTYWHADIYDA